MVRIVLWRLATAVPVLFLMSIFTFVLVSLIPGNAAIAILGRDATPQKIAALNAQLGLNRPVFSQYLTWLGHALHGNLGTSITSGVPVSELIWQRLPPTLFLAGFATLAAAIIGVAIGIYAAVRGGALARILDMLGMLGISLPNYWIALLLIIFVAGDWHMFPGLGYTDPGTSLTYWFEDLVLPVTALAVAGVAMIAKQSRDAMATGLSREFIRFMQANGVSRRALIYRHALRFAAVPIVSAIAGCFINLFGGTVAVETVFNIPGLGSMVATSTSQHDVVVIQGAVVAYTIVIIIVLLISDVARSILTPRLRTR